MASLNERYHSLDSRTHPLVRGQYAVFTPPMIEATNWIIEWIDTKSSGYIVGFSRFGKTWFVRFCLPVLLSEYYLGGVPIFVHFLQVHGRFSESTFLYELLASCDHKCSRGKTLVLFDRLIRHYSTAAAGKGANQIVLVVDEAQAMEEPHYRVICNLDNELDRLGFKMSVVSIGSHEMSYRHEVIVHSGHIHLNARYLLRNCTFRGIANLKELAAVLRAYDELLIWPENSNQAYTQFFFPASFGDGFRFANCAETMWECYLTLGPKKRGYALEVPMQYVAKPIEYICRTIRDEDVLGPSLKAELVQEAIDATGYSAHMEAVWFALKDKGEKSQ
jgi:hypothetical protein